MLFSIENARYNLSKFWLTLSGLNAMSLVMFLFPLVGRDVPTHYILTAMSVAALIGLIMGMYLTFRSTFDSKYGFLIFFYGLIVLEFLFSGGASAAATLIAGRQDLCWLAVYTNIGVMAFSLLGAMYRETKALGIWNANTRDRWKDELDKYVDYSSHKVSPSLTDRSSSIALSSSLKNSMWIAAIGSANIPLLFELYGEGRNNSIFLAAPLLTSVFAYLNLKHIGPGVVRLLLLRKLEKAIGRRFVNADLEHIQELRRTFFLSRWLMKDYARSIPISTPLTSSPTVGQKKSRKRL